MEYIILILVCLLICILLILLFGALKKSLTDSMGQMEQRLGTLESTNEQKLDNLRETMERRLAFIQRDSNKRLESIESTMDEKLHDTFELMGERLEQVYKGLGEMQSLASGVGDLKKVLSNVKTRGILGELQLGAILEDILTSSQYDVNVATVPNSSAVVEFALKIPSDDGGFIYLPIDSKFPSDAYIKLQNAQDAGDPKIVAQAEKELVLRLKSFAKDIHTKYVRPPHTTDFAVMFLPFEGLYCEAVRLGMIEELQRLYRISIAGPSTMASLLSTVRMMFKTVAIKQRSDDLWGLLSEIKIEFDKFEETLNSTRQRLNQADAELDKLVGTRTRAIKKQLRDIESFEEK